MALKTYDKALNLLSFRERSSKELAKRLKDKGEAPEAIDQAVSRLHENGLLDDTRFAESRARSGIVGKARSRRRIQQDLAQRGVSREVADQAITKVLDEEGTSELLLAERAARKKLRSLDRYEGQEKRQKLYAFLARQGYPGDVVSKVLKRVLDATVDEELP
jgi:regulatory protein